MPARPAIAVGASSTGAGSMPRQVRCLSCGHPLSRYASRCPRCGAAQPHKRSGSTVGLALLLVLLAAVVFWALIGGA